VQPLAPTVHVDEAWTGAAVPTTHMYVPAVQAFVQHAPPLHAPLVQACVVDS
jgi:quinol monooxygenase YgiN